MAVVERKNVLVAGGTSSGKTTLANALLNEMAALDERVILIEDTRELQCAAPDTVALRTRPGVVSMADLVRSTLRLRHDRIIVGEVRGGEALDMLKAWNKIGRAQCRERVCQYVSIPVLAVSIKIKHIY